MKCEGCGYTHGHEWNENDEYIEYIGKEGAFFTLPIKLEQRTNWGEDIVADVYGCPKCKIVFFEK